MNEFSKMLTHKRESKKLSKVQVAEIMGLTPMYYARFENGYLYPTKRNIKQFSEFLEIEEKELLSLIELSKKR